MWNLNKENVEGGGDLFIYFRRKEFLIVLVSGQDMSRELLCRKDKLSSDYTPRGLGVRSEKRTQVSGWREVVGVP